MAAEKTIRDLLGEFAALSPRALPDDQKRALLRTWLRLFAGVRDELLRYACDELLSSHKYSSIPVPGEVKKAIERASVKIESELLTLDDVVDWTNRARLMWRAAAGDRVAELWLDAHPLELAATIDADHVKQLEATAHARLAAQELERQRQS